ncbi:MAG: peptide deformylase [Candidatus Curtissbacteria bacterium]|nr:peptide deformylase [Candidatus Curtissbacteria bacterium]
MLKDIKLKIKTFQTVLEKIPELRYAGESILREATIPTTLEEGVSLAKKLEEVLLKYREITGLGRGLAAPQIGKNKSVFIAYIDNQTEIFINPKIVEKSNKTNFYRELCMSAGIVAADVERPVWIVMEWTDKDGNRKSEKFDGLKARLYQHEEAHLRGRLNLDDAVSGGIQFATFDPLKEQLRNKKS